MFTNVRYILLTALRDWLFAALLVGLLVCAFAAHLLGSTALIENQEMTISYISASARVMVITGLIVFTCFHVRNAFDTKEIDVFLSRPVTRSNLVFSYWLGFAAVSVLLVIPMLVLIAVLGGVLNNQGFFFWSLSMLLECWLMETVTLFAAFTLRSAVTSTIASMGFYVFTRMMGFFVVTSSSSSVFNERWLNELLFNSLKWLSMIMPRLDFFAKSDWLIYGLKNTPELKLYTIQAVVFIPFLIFVTILDFRRKEF